MSVCARKAADPARTPSTLSELVDLAARVSPDTVALVGLDVERTWAAVDRDTRGLASRLVACGVRPGDRVAVARRKGHESFEAVHGVLRAGGTVVPIDPFAPPAVARQVIADAGVRAVVGDAATVGPLDPWSAVDHELTAVVVSGELSGRATLAWDDAVRDRSTVSLPVIDPDDPAYIIYTSGSTGRPKGIVHSHRSALAYATRAASEYGLGPHDRLAGMNPLHFDMSTLELYAAPLARVTVVVMSEPHLQFPASFTQRSAEQAVTIWYTVPFLLRAVEARGGLDKRPLPALRAVLYGGESYPGAALRRLMGMLPGVEVVNVYGPAEVNACAHHHVADVSSLGDRVPIGRPWADTEVRVVDDGGHDVGTGTPGELWVSTPTVMDRYWGGDELTRARLRPRRDGPPWYATGDIVTRDSTGLLWFEGRRDHQVKVRGVRLELDAIEAVLAGAPDVVHAVAGPSDDLAHIVAAVVLRDGARPDTPALRRWCADRLSAVAVPHRIQYVTDLPATASGKVDRAAVRARLRLGDVPQTH
mgnify:CR=1 FL=1